MAVNKTGSSKTRAINNDLTPHNATKTGWGANGVCSSIHWHDTRQARPCDLEFRGNMGWDYHSLTSIIFGKWVIGGILFAGARKFGILGGFKQENERLTKSTSIS